jgi:hypothetical protein
MTEDWLPYPRDRKMKYEGSYIVIVPSSYDESKRKDMPLFCGVCNFSFSHKEDEISFKEFQCCTTCADTWAYSHRTEWEKGWRPSVEQVDVNNQKRLFVNTDIRFE